MTRVEQIHGFFRHPVRALWSLLLLCCFVCGLPALVQAKQHHPRKAHPKKALDAQARDRKKRVGMASLSRRDREIVRNLRFLMFMDMLSRMDMFRSLELLQNLTAFLPANPSDRRAAPKR